MESYKKEFIEFMVDSQVLKFGEFTLKSGRKSPFFMNAGGYVTGAQLERLGEYYARAIHDNYGLDFDVLFETCPIIRAQAKVEIKGLMVSLNRMEKGQSDKSALMEIKEKYGFDANAIVNMQEVIEYLYNKPLKGQIYIDDRIKEEIDAYYKQYGAR